ncbi:MAG: tRNA 2-thiouridine(34) synthase MnmA [Pirellulales bacterium]|nr:tRNA 2-thiouridine(34) synthase MnmA [Pirellulales bacterium]
MSRVVLAMSGGVDSSVAAWLLAREGHDVVGLFMRHGQADAPARSPDQHTGCCSAADAADARRVADGIGIPFHALNFEREFDRVVDYFVDEYAAGRTPNPCIVCNTWLKFGKLFEYADAVGAEFVATGHYARLAPGKDGVALCRGVDTEKDQSYVLFGIDRDVLGRLRFPVGEYRKEAIREMAREQGLLVSDKPDSQEICFVPDRDHAGFVRRRRPGRDTAGEIVTPDGAVVGRHDGFERFTVGQRKGLGVALGEPYFVVRIEPESRRVVLGRREELARRTLTARGANWLVPPPDGPFRAAVKIRYRSRAVEAVVTPLGEDRFRVDFDEPRHGVAPGQAAVCYRGDRVLGGGWIEAEPVTL